MEIRELFSDNDQDIMLDIIGFSIANTNDIAERCSNFKVDLSQRHLPKYKMTEEEFKKYDGSKVDMLISLVADGFNSMGISDVDEQEKYLDRLETEIDVIKYGDVVDYFLILWDITQWCKRQGILVGFGRGSACGSLVAYLLGLTHINPFDYDLLFERFLNKGRIGQQVEVDVVKITFDNNLDIELDFDDKVCIFRSGEKLDIKAQDLKDGDRIVSVGSGDISKMLERTKESV